MNILKLVGPYFYHIGQIITHIFGHCFKMQRYIY